MDNDVPSCPKSRGRSVWCVHAARLVMDRWRLMGNAILIPRPNALGFGARRYGLGIEPVSSRTLLRLALAMMLEAKTLGISVVGEAFR